MGQIEKYGESWYFRRGWTLVIPTNVPTFIMTWTNEQMNLTLLLLLIHSLTMGENFPVVKLA